MSIYTRPAAAKNDNPNLALVILLVVFVLTSIGLGLWGYYGYDEQESLRKNAKDKSEEAAAKNLTKDYYHVLAMELKLIDGYALSDNERSVWAVSREELFKEKGKFSGQNGRNDYMDIFIESRDELGWDVKAGKYGTTWKEKYEAMEKEVVVKLKADLVAKEKAFADQAKREKDLLSQVESYDRKYRKLATDMEKAVTAAKTERIKYMEDISNRNSDLLRMVDAEKEKAAEQQRQWFVEKEALDERYMKMESRVKQAAGVVGGGERRDDNKFRNNAIGQSLLALDISMGKPLWDVPVGKVLSVIGDKVLIQVEGDGVEQRLRTRLTFNVFGSLRGKDGIIRADGSLKGTLELISLEGGRTAICRMTSRYNEKENPMVEGDLIYNVVWGTHVAVVGHVNLFRKTGGESQLEQVGNLKHFLGKLEDQGVIVDAYVDLADGNIKGKYGALTNLTRFLIKGEDLDAKKAFLAAEADAPKDDREKADKFKEMVAARVQEINKNNEKLVNDAKDLGVFIISAENFANIAGYRKLGGYGPDDAAPFQPSLPAAGAR